MPEKGPFDVIYEREDVKEMRLGLSHLILKITSVGSGDNEKKRYLELAAVNYPSPYGATSVVGYGDTQDTLISFADKMEGGRFPCRLVDINKLAHALL